MNCRLGLISWALLIITVSSSMFFTGCSSSHRKDGPPNFYVDASKIPNAVPKPERRSKYGNMHSYKVFGKRYYPLRSSRNFTQTGVASWYGSKFHDRKTSSGEKYDMLAMTAAHKTLPLPTYVEVTNLKNHKKIIVKVNDRGPFASNRIIDLSYVAAKKLGMLGKGTTRVKIRAINPYVWAKNKGRSVAKRYRSKTNKINRYAKNHTTKAKNFAKKHIANTKEFIHKKTSKSKHTTTKSSKGTNLAKNTNAHSKKMVNKHFANKKKTSKTKHVSKHPGGKYVYLQAGAFKSESYALRFKKRLDKIIRDPVRISYPKENSQLYRVRIGPIKNTASEKKIIQKLNTIGISPNKIRGA